MKRHYGNVVLITGASSGIGKSCADYMVGLGYKVYGTSRKVRENTFEEMGNGVTMVRMDVCSQDSVKEAVESIISREGEIGILVNNAGMGIAGAVEDTSPQEAFLQMDTNFFGMHRVVRQVLPHMRKKGSGLIINMSSVGALFPIPYQSMYVAAKAAVEGMTGSLRNELRPFGIKVAYVEPGDTKTGFTGSRIMAEDSGEGSAYHDYCKKSIAVMERDETNGPDPITVARVVAGLAERKSPPVCITVGLKYKLLVFLKRLVPKALESYLLSKMYEG